MVNRQYYGTSSAIDTPHGEVKDIYLPSPSEDASSKQNSAQHACTFSTGSIIDIQLVEPKPVHVPTSSDMLTNHYEDDMIVMSDSDQQARAKGVEPRERKEMSLQLQEKRRIEREENSKKAQKAQKYM